jgi:hypothetical protein
VTTWLLVEIKGQFNARSLGSASATEAAWLKTITKNMFDVVAGITMIAAVFYLAAITQVLPLPESALTRLSGFSSNVMDVLFACGSWVIRLFVD